MYSIAKGEIIQVQGGVSASGFIYWTAPGKRSVLAATVEAGKILMLGPYQTDATFEIVMQTGAPIMQTIRKAEIPAPVPLADFMLD